MLDTWSSGQLVAGGDAEADLQWQLLASLRQLDEVCYTPSGLPAERSTCCRRIGNWLTCSSGCLL